MSSRKMLESNRNSESLNIKKNNKKKAFWSLENKKKAFWSLENSQCWYFPTNTGVDKFEFSRFPLFSVQLACKGAEGMGKLISLGHVQRKTEMAALQCLRQAATTSAPAFLAFGFRVCALLLQEEKGPCPSTARARWSCWVPEHRCCLWGAV